MSAQASADQMSELEGPTQLTSAPASLVGTAGLVYKPLRQLGEGGMAQVYLACAYGSAGFSKLVVLKIVRGYLDHSSVRAMFLEEARVSATLNHPNLVQVYEVVDADPSPYMVMEYLEGKPLTKLRGGTLPREMVLTAVSEALVGLHHAHEAHDFDGTPLKLVHRDISPHNIYITYDGVVKILDFGIAKTTGAAGETQTGEVKGKLTYMPPEQLLGEQLDRRADIFSMGVVLWEMVLGAPMWGKLDQAVLIQRLATGDIPRPSESAKLDPELEAIIVRATASEPSERFQTALEMQQAITAYQEKSGLKSTPLEVGRALAAAFAEDRTADREATRLALEAPSVPPPTEVVAEAELPPEVVEELPPPEPPAWQRLGTWLLLVPLCVVLAIGIGKLRKTEAPPPQAAPTVAVKQGARMARLAFQVSPAQSRVEIDGQVRGTGTFELAVPADSSEHRLVVSAPGHITISRSIRFEGSQTLDLVLVTEPVAQPAPEPSREAPSRTGARANVRGPKGVSDVAKPAAPEPQESPKTPEANPCDPPYYFKDGIKTFRQECL